MFSNINRISGLSGSGFDTEGTIDKLMQAQRKKYDKMFQQKQTLIWKKEAYREINTSLAKIRDVAYKLRLQSTFMAKKASASDETKLSVTAGASANDGITKIAITQLAEGASKTSQDKITEEGGTTTALSTQFSNLSAMGSADKISFKINGKLFEYSGDDVSNISIYTVLEQINNATIGVKAAYDKNLDRIFLTSNGTGSNQKIELEDVAGSYVSFLKDNLKLDMTGVYGKDAKIYLNDTLAPISQSTNSFSINGITYNLRGTTGFNIDGTPNYLTVNVTTDVDTVFNTIKGFMEEYNSIVDTLYDKINEEKYKDYLPLTDEQKKAMKEDEIKKWEEKAKSGILKRDSILSDVLDKMRFNISDPVVGLTDISQLTQIGIETGKYTEHGKLKFSDDTGDKLKEIIRNNPDDVIKLFTKTGDTAAEKGIGTRMYESLNQALKDINKVSGFTAIPSDDSVLGKQIGGIDTKMNAESRRLMDVENSYWRKFTAMEKALSGMMNQSMWLSQQLGGGQ